MCMLRKYSIVIVGMLVGSGVFLLWSKQVLTPSIDETQPVPFVIEPLFLKSETATVKEMKVSEPSLPIRVSIDEVPFTTQAPFGEWGDPLFQNGCEEASLIMAAHWISDTLLTQEKARQEIITLSRFEEKKWGHAVDTSIRDTEKLFREYYHIASSEVIADGTITDIQHIIANGKIVIVPADGRKLQNPHFTHPGPVTHMLLIIGYDTEKKEFITNDPGTRYGQGYRYDEHILYNAIRDYPTGDHLPIRGMEKTMLVVGKL